MSNEVDAVDAAVQEVLARENENLRNQVRDLNRMFDRVQQPQSDPRLVNALMKFEAYLPQLTNLATNQSITASAVQSVHTALMTSNKVNDRIATALERIAAHMEGGDDADD